MNSLDNINDFKERHFTIILIFGAVFSLIFDNIPKALQLNTLSGGYSSKLSWYFLFALLLISLYTIYKHGFTEYSAVGVPPVRQGVPFVRRGVPLAIFR